MIRKLAIELATNDQVKDETNDIRPANEPDAPPAKEDASVTRYGFTPEQNENNLQGQLGVLSRAMSGYKDHVRGFNDSLSKALGDHVRKITGSSSQSLAAVRRHQNSSKG